MATLLGVTSEPSDCNPAFLAMRFLSTSAAEGQDAVGLSPRHISSRPLAEIMSRPKSEAIQSFGTCEPSLARLCLVRDSPIPRKAHPPLLSRPARQGMTWRLRNGARAARAQAFDLFKMLLLRQGVRETAPTLWSSRRPAPALKGRVFANFPMNAAACGFFQRRRNSNLESP